GDLGAPARLRAVVVLAPDDGTADRALGGVVVERNARVIEESREAVPVGDRVRCGLADRERLEDGLVPEPVLELGQRGRRLGAAELGQALEVPVGARVDLVERTNRLKRALGLR